MKSMLLVYSLENAWTKEEWTACTVESTAVCHDLQSRGNISLRVAAAILLGHQLGTRGQGGHFAVPRVQQTVLPQLLADAADQGQIQRVIGRVARHAVATLRNRRSCASLKHGPPSRARPREKIAEIRTAQQSHAT